MPETRSDIFGMVNDRTEVPAVSEAGTDQSAAYASLGYVAGQYAAAYPAAAANGITAVTLPGTTTAGNTLIACVSCDGTQTIAWAPPTDTYGNTWYTDAGATFDNGTSRMIQIWWSRLSSGGAGHQVSFTGQAWYGQSLFVAEFSGLSASPYLANARFTNGSGAQPSVGPVNVTASPALVIVFTGNTNIATDYTAGSGFTKIAEVDAGTDSVALEYQVVSSTGNVTGSWTLTPMAAAANLMVVLA